MSDGCAWWWLGMAGDGSLRLILVNDRICDQRMVRYWVTVTDGSILVWWWYLYIYASAQIRDNYMNQWWQRRMMNACVGQCIEDPHQDWGSHGSRTCWAETWLLSCTWRRRTKTLPLVPKSEGHSNHMPPPMKNILSGKLQLCKLLNISSIERNSSTITNPTRNNETMVCKGQGSTIEYALSDVDQPLLHRWWTTDELPNIDMDLG